MVAYVPGFEYDIFLSYASDDLDDKLTALLAELRLALRRELGKDFSNERGIFLDKDELNQTPIVWKEKLKQSAGSAAILVPILSTAYATSEYCAKEFEWFCENSLQKPLTWPAGNQTVYRICPVSWRNIDPNLLAQVASDIRRAQEDRSSAAEDLALKLANGLRMMRRSCQTVYLGECQHEIRLKVREELSRVGFSVEPQAPSAFADSERIRTLLGQAKLAIHFVGNQESARPLNAIRDSRQYCQHATLVYEVPGVDLCPEEKISLEWLEDDLRQAPASDTRKYQRIAGSLRNLDQFLQVIRDLLEVAHPVSATQIGVACEDSDLPAVDLIIPEIQNRTGFSVICHGLSLFDFKKSRALLLYWGRSDGRRLRQARPILKDYFAFFLAPPPKGDEHKTELAGVTILYQQADQFHINDIRPFLETLGWRS
jgi:hypothetical protein